MKGERRTTRRRFLIAAGVATAAAAGGGILRLRGGEPRLLTSRVAAALADDPVRAIGRGYLHVRPDENDESTLVALLERRPEWRSVNSVADVRRALTDGGRVDFSTGRVVNVGGWRLAETEGRVCALATFA